MLKEKERFIFNLCLINNVPCTDMSGNCKSLSCGVKESFPHLEKVRDFLESVTVHKMSRVFAVLMHNNHIADAEAVTAIIRRMVEIETSVNTFKVLALLHVTGIYLVVSLCCDRHVKASEIVKIHEGHLLAKLIIFDLVDVQRSFLFLLRFRHNWNYGYLAVYLGKHFRLFEQLRVFLLKLRRERAEIIIGQSRYHESTGDDVINLSVLSAERTIELQAVQLSFLVTDKCDRIVVRINRLDVSANSLLQRSQAAVDLLSIRLLHRLDNQYRDFTAVFFLKVFINIGHLLAPFIHEFSRCKIAPAEFFIVHLLKLVYYPEKKLLHLIVEIGERNAFHLGDQFRPV